MKHIYCPDCGRNLVGNDGCCCGWKQEPDQPEHIVLEEYDAGYLNDYGGGNVSWWQDYIRAELESAYDFYQSQLQ